MTTSKTVLIVGAKEGIGLELAKKFHERGYRVYGTVRSLEKDKDHLGPLSAVATQILEIDLADENTIQSAAQKFGEDKPLDLLINSAALGPGPLDWGDYSADILVEWFRVNTVGPFLTTKHFYPALERSPRGKIINLSSNMASMSSLSDNPQGRHIGYRISKAALNQLTVSLGREFKSHESKVTANAIHPGWIPTTMTGFIGPDDMEVQTAAIVETIEKLEPGDTGKFLNAWGEDFPW
ncbi:short chain dehydrogenase [Cladorrhinum sp. PSN259]|nr:short chain dehydrogenase [Cladorrhinum sp. PSN259]